MRVIRVFPRRTKATPTDELAYFGPPDLFAEADRIHISVTFTYDLKRAEELEKQWKHVAPVWVGGPAMGEKGNAFTPGMYLKKGYVITSRGCPNSCWFCDVWKREGQEVRELPIAEGWNVLDDNLLACSDSHMDAVFNMLEKQRKRPEFTGGLEAARLNKWNAGRLALLRPKQLFFAYDTPNDLEPLREASRLLENVGLNTGHKLRCYVLCGYPRDTFDAALKRMKETLEVGFTPMAMLYRDKIGRRDPEWRKFQREWARPAIIHRREGNGK